MTPQKNKSPVRQPWPWWRWGLLLLNCLALALSTYLSWHFLMGGKVIGCGGGSPCDQVLSSRWSSIGGVLPVTGLAAGVYLAMLMACIFIGPTTETSVRRLAWQTILLLVGAAAGSAVWFTIVQKWIIGSFCPYCMATHIAGLLLAVLVIWQAPKQQEVCLPEKTPAPSALPSNPSRPVIGRLSALGLALTGVGLAGTIAICQSVIKPPPEYRAGQSDEKLAVIDPHVAPLIGSPDAAYIVNLLFDYRCPHCQQLHFMLNEAVRRYQGKLAFALCPSPLNPQCNPYVPREVDEFKGSCELAKIALSVWAAKREAFPTFDHWMFSLESGDRWQPRSIEAAKAKAVELVGQAKFDAAQSDPWVQQYLETAVKIYGTTTGGGNNAVPKLVFGSHWVIPQPNDAEELMTILHNSLGLPLP